MANSKLRRQGRDRTAEMLRKENVVTDALSRKERVKPRRVRAMAMTIQYGVRGMILTAQSEAFKQENVPLVGSEMDEAHASRLRWIIYLVVLADAAESVRDTIGFENCLASSSGWTKSPVLWAEIEESSLTRPELVLDTTNKVVLIKEKLKAARDRQKSYADNRRKPLEFEVGDRVMLKVSPWKGVIRFGKKGKLAPRYVGPFEILERVGPVAYRLRLPEELSGIKVDKTLRFVEEPVENSDCEVMRLKCSRMVIVKVRFWLEARSLRLQDLEAAFEHSVRRVTCGYPWPELEGKRFGMIQERYGSFAWCLRDWMGIQQDEIKVRKRLDGP
ncbi:hypothetical protein Tco_1428565 [Tanacetum coccineum]